MLNILWASAAALAGPRTGMVGFTSAPTEAIRAIESHGGVVGRCFQRARFCVADFPGDAPLPLGALSEQPGIRYAEADRIIPGTDLRGSHPDASGTEDCKDLWALDEIGARQAWAHADGAGAPVVAIADGGFLQTHEEITGRFTGQWDYGDGDSTANLEWDVGIPAHGTFIAGIVAARASNGVGRAGVLPQGRLNLLKIADSSGAFYFSYAASALADVADGDLGIRAVNYSIASSSYTASFRDAVASLGPLEIVLVAAAGNCAWAGCSDADNDAYPLYPANFTDDHVITVAGSVQGGGHNSYSHYGRQSVDLAAPGVDICSLGVNSTDDYYTAAGTSYAAPLVAASAVLLIEAHPDLTALEVSRVLRASADAHPDWETRAQAGVLDLAGAVQTPVPRLSPPDGAAAVDGTGLLTLDAYNAGAEGPATIVVFHENVSVLSAEGWSVVPFSAGDSLDLPDAGSVTVSAGGSLLTGPLPAHETTTVTLDLAGTVLGAADLSVRLVTTASDGDGYLNTPYRSGTEDSSGFLAYTVAVTVTALPPEDTAAPDDTAEPSDSGEPDTAAAPDSGEPVEEAEPEAEPGCSCNGGAAGAPWLWALALAAVARRRGGRR